MKRPRVKLKPKIGKGLGQCIHRGKSQYADEKSATAAMMFIFAHDSTIKPGDLHVYDCPICGFKHVGHRDDRFAT